VARAAFGANVREEALYPQTDADDRGRKLTGRHKYVLEFPPGKLPPVRAFWSVTLYDAEHFLVENPIERYAIGDRTPGLRYGKRGGLKIRISAEPPESGTENWLPAPRGRFELLLRLYEPKPAAYKGRWVPPAVRRVR